MFDHVMRRSILEDRQGFRYSPMHHLCGLRYPTSVGLGLIPCRACIALRTAPTSSLHPARYRELKIQMFGYLARLSARHNDVEAFLLHSNPILLSDRNFE
jgi:hypothetical protein